MGPDVWPQTSFAYQPYSVEGTTMQCIYALIYTYISEKLLDSTVKLGLIEDHKSVIRLWT